MMPESQISSNITNESFSQTSTIETINIDSNLTEQSIDTNNIDEIVTVTPSTSTTTTTTTTSPSSSTINNNNEPIPPIISSPWLKGMLMNTKSLPELYKIIEKLNFNLTLSNRYLQELSQHYVKKLDETQQTTDLLLKSSQAADERLANLEEYLYRLEENFNQISSRSIKLEAWIPLIIFLILCLFIWCLWSTCSLFRLRRKLKHIINEYEKLSNTNLEEYLYRLEENFNQISSRLIKLEAWIPLIIFLILCLSIWCLWSTYSLFRLKRKLKHIINEYEKISNIKQIENNNNDDNDDNNMNDISRICNGLKKRKLSTDSTDSNPNRSQRVPDLTLSKIKENGIHNIEHKIKRKPSKHTQHLSSLSRMQT
ncbi:unnamed protein product [Rotaria sp. Silwood1]|nr:unnamed protein product [Rotaria sp. Silwood1]